MFGGNLSTPFDDDPFFRNHSDAMQRMMNGLHEPFFAMNPPMINAPESHTGLHQQLGLAPVNMFPHMSSAFGNMGSMFANMHQSFGELANDENAHTSSTMTSFRSNGQDPPQYYHATSSTRNAPGKIKETQKSVRDSVAGVHTMAIEQHIGDRGHMYEMSRNDRTGEMEEKRDFLNMDDGDANHFDREWRERTRHPKAAPGYEQKHRHRRHTADAPRAVTERRVNFKSRPTARHGDHP